MGRVFRHRRRAPRAPAGQPRRRQAAAAGRRGQGRETARAVDHPVLRAPGPDCPHGPDRVGRRQGDAGRLQARQAPARRTRRLRSRAGAALRAGTPAARARLPVRRGRALLRGEPRTGAHRVRRRARRRHPAGGRGVTARRHRGRHPAAARGQSQVSALLAGRGLPPRRGPPSQGGRGRAAPDRRALHRRAASIRAGPPGEGLQVGRDPGRDGGGRRVGDSPAGGDLAGRRHGQRLPDHAHPARADVARDSRHLAQLRRLVLRPYHGQRAQERRAADGPVSGELRREDLRAVRPGTRGRQDPELPHAAPPQLEACREQQPRPGRPEERRPSAPPAPNRCPSCWAWRGPPRPATSGRSAPC